MPHDKSTSEPEWVRTCRVLGRLGEWEAVLRIYLPRWKANDPWLATDTEQWKTILTGAYFKWWQMNQTTWKRVDDESEPRQQYP